MPEPRRGGLHRDRIVAEGVRIADAEGLVGLSMGKVAARLGFTAMSLYRHVASKDELVLLMQDAAIGPSPRLAGTGWRAALEEWTWAALARFRAHPWMLQAVAMFGPPATPHQLGWLESALGALAPTGLAEPEKVNTVLLLSAHVFADLQWAAFGTAPGVPDPAGYGARLAELLDADRFPAVLRAVHGGAFAPAEGSRAERDADFAFGLARILDGVEHLVRSRTGP
ncbi:TetR/AcrR family transcriptional regulator [Pseudonocardia sp.]|uniref:TetR/AcrR family transcriptional regulator n=1 Tax=Pseudonocardia sp. TaxID=60912 RepID=UPI003D0A7295